MDHKVSSACAEDRTSLRFKLKDGRQLSYAKYGQHGGYPIIFLHGSPGSRIAVEEEIYSRLGVEIIYPERPGYGNSTPNPTASFRSWADDVVGMLDHWDIEQVDIAGASAGGAYALACIAFYPHRFRSATLIGSAAPPQTPHYRRGMVFGNRLAIWLSKYAPFLIRAASRNFARKFKKHPDQVWQQISKQLCEADQLILKKAKEKGTYPAFVDHLMEAFRNGIEGHVADIRNIARPWAIPIESIQCPVYLWHGTADTLSPIAGAKAMATWLPTAQAKFLPNFGHLLAEDEVILEKLFREILYT